jgi:hypothetical protein
MTSLATAKVLLFIALSMAPEGTQKIFATSNSDNYVWMKDDGAWSLKTKVIPVADYTVMGSEQAPQVTDSMETIRRHHRSREDTVLDLKNGNQIEQQGNAVFYIVDPGAPNEKVYTILYPHPEE